MQPKILHPQMRPQQRQALKPVIHGKENPLRVPASLKLPVEPNRCSIVFIYEAMNIALDRNRLGSGPKDDCSCSSEHAK